MKRNYGLVLSVLAEGSQVVRLVEPMDVQLTSLEKQVHEVENYNTNQSTEDRK